MSVLFYDRFATAFSLAFHIIFASIGIALPAIIAIAEYNYIKRKDIYYRALANRLSIALAILFAIGTASGTLVAIDLLALWPKFMSLVGEVAILPLFTEVFAFFGESILLGTYLYLRDRIKSDTIRFLLISGVAFFAASSGVLITMINAFMNTPVGFNIDAYLQSNTIEAVNPLAAFDTPSTPIEEFHVISTAYLSGSIIFLAYFAFMLNKNRMDKIKKQYYIRGVKIAFGVAFISLILAVISGVLSIEMLYHLQPEKYAAFELDIYSQADAPEVIFGYYNAATNSIKDAIIIPGLQSILANGSVSAVVPGLDQFPKDTWPPLFVHDLFDAMVIIGFTLASIYILALLLIVLKKISIDSKAMMYISIISAALVVSLLEMGWVAAEVGRQPWIIYNVMTVNQAANYSSSVIPIAIAIVVIYAILLPFTIYILKRVFSSRPIEKYIGEYR
ncbi:MAG: cytochrome ubiquinol oxidase subunit I [Candidatus Micrarchaeota archaeon]|nr:MAG: cytochrome ubiquinol oxidase subunit I [Candidatus Micrarchaeota archaeon]